MTTYAEAAPPRTRTRTDRLFNITFTLFAGSIVFSVAGMLLLKLAPSTMAFFGPYYPTLVKTPTWIYMALLPVLAVLMYGPMLGARRMLFFVLWGSIIGGASELVGTTTGLPFGEYAYGAWLGPKIAGHVPYFIPLSWFAMSIVSYDLAHRVTHRRIGRILLGTVFMVLWDVALDPAMSTAFPFWDYPNGGFFFGMPLSNWVGWFGVTLVIMTGYELIGGGLPRAHPWALWVYALNGLFPLMISALRDLYLAALIGLAAVSLPLLVVWWTSGKERGKGRVGERERGGPAA